MLCLKCRCAWKVKIPIQKKLLALIVLIPLTQFSHTQAWFQNLLYTEVLTYAFNQISHKCLPLPNYKVSGIYKPQICRKLAARLRLIVAARLPQTRFSYANYFSGALFWHTMCATSMQRTVVAHCSDTQWAPQVCGAQLSRTVLVHNVRRKFAAHNCRALFWYTMCAASLLRTVVVHCSVCHKFAAHSCRALRCSAPTPSLSPHPHIFF